MSDNKELLERLDHAIATTKPSQDHHNIMRDARDYISRKGWQTMDSAPRDGTAILGCMPGPQVDIIWWDEKAGEGGGWRDYYYKQIVLPYFGWQPLPLPPTQIPLDPNVLQSTGSSSTESLKSCPFCGQQPELHEPTHSDPWYYVYCRCFAQKIFLSSQSFKAIDRWNTRSSQSTDNELLTYDMTEEIAEIKKLYSESPHILDYTAKSGFKLPILNILMEFINRPQSTDGGEVSRLRALLSECKDVLYPEQNSYKGLVNRIKLALANPNKGD